MPMARGGDEPRTSAGDSLGDAIERSGAAARAWWAGGRGSGADSALLEIPDVGPTCEVLLADAVFHDLEPLERASMLDWVRAEQDSSGAWLDAEGRADLSMTALAWWARLQHGDDPDERSMQSALRTVHALGGAQRASFIVRLWLAMAGAVPWSWLPAIPSELWLLPAHAPLAPARISPWARAVVTPCHLLADAPARVHLADASAMLLNDHDGETILPRLTKPGLAGDLLQSFDRAIKLSRKLARGPVKRMAVERAREQLEATQQEHGGWFSVRPTIYAAMALRVLGTKSDDARLRDALEYLRRARGWVERDGKRFVVQGLQARGIAALARLHCAAGPDEVRELLNHEISTAGPWQRRADAPAGAWPAEVDGQSHLDVEATCAVLETLRHCGAHTEAASWGGLRRAADALFAMQEPDGGFARFERGESEVPISRMPWRDADELSHERADDSARLERSAVALRELHALGWRLEDDRVTRGVNFLGRAVTEQGRTMATATLAQALRALAHVCPQGHPARDAAERELRTRQSERGDFGDRVSTARALRALTALGEACVQSRRAARWLATNTPRPQRERTNDERAPRRAGLGLSPTVLDPSAPDRETHLALRSFRSVGGEL